MPEFWLPQIYNVEWSHFEYNQVLPILGTSEYCPILSKVIIVSALGCRGLGTDSSRTQCTHEYSRLGPEKEKYYPFGKDKILKKWSLRSTIIIISSAATAVVRK